MWSEDLMARIRGLYPDAQLKLTSAASGSVDITIALAGRMFLLQTMKTGYAVSEIFDDDTAFAGNDAVFTTTHEVEERLWQLLDTTVPRAPAT